MIKEKNKILIIDDSDDILDLLEMYLYKDYNITTAQNGFDGLKKAQEDFPDCIITDIMMPVMDGIKFLNTLKNNETISHIPVIAVTSFVKKINTKSLMNMGFVGVISKPLNMISIIDTIKKTISPETDYAK